MSQASDRLVAVGLDITAHATEFLTANLKAVLRVPGVTRIDHGIHALATDELSSQLLPSGAAL